MAASSTNKQPLLVDRPLMVIARLDNTTSPAASADPGTGSNGVLLVDCTANDGAVIDTIYLVQRFDDEVTKVNLYISSSAYALGVTSTGGSANAFFINRFGFAAASKIGTQLEVRLPKLLAPVPHAGSNSTEGLPPQFRGLYIQAGQALWAAAESAVAVPHAPSIVCQGGYF